MARGVKIMITTQALLFSTITLLAKANDFSQVEMATLLGGTGPFVLTATDKELSASSVHDTFGICQSTCNVDKPCGIYSDDHDHHLEDDSHHANGPTCVAPLSFTNSIGAPTEIKYCNPQASEVCCYPELCQIPVVECEYDSTDIESLESKVDIDALNAFATIASDDLVDAMMSDLSPVSVLHKECTSNCNGWNQGGVGDLSNLECPVQCQCKIVPAATIVASPTMSCRHTELAYAFITTEVHSYNHGFDTMDGKQACAEGDFCTDSTVCMSFEEYTARVAQEDALAAAQEAKNEEAEDDESGLSTVAIVLIVVGCVAFVAIVALVVILKKKKQSSTESDGGDYQAM